MTMSLIRAVMGESQHYKTVLNNPAYTTQQHVLLVKNFTRLPVLFQFSLNFR